jgi:Cys-tRNA(Pro)/Cys-tRNA(Cys) deacylase
MSTRAIQVLKKAQVPFEIITYPHKEKGAAAASQAIGFPLEKTVKTLITDIGDGRYAAALLPGSKQLHLKKLARVFQSKHAAMADIARAERLSGYSIGGISPFGLRQPLASVMDRSIMDHESIVINGGQRGVMLKMRPSDILSVLACTVAEIARENRV